MPWSSQVLEQGVVRGERAGPDVGGPVGPAAAGQDGLGVGERLAVAEGAAEAALALHLDDQGGQTRQRAAIRASVALTVVLPTPPFPATMKSRAWAQNSPGSTHSPSGGPLIRRVLMVVCLLGAMATAPAWPRAPMPRTAPGRLSPRAATPDAAVVRGHIDVIQLNGLIDPIEADFVSQSIAPGRERWGPGPRHPAEQHRRGAVPEQPRAPWPSRVARSTVPVAIWVGPERQPGLRCRPTPFSGRRRFEGWRRGPGSATPRRCSRVLPTPWPGGPSGRPQPSPARSPPSAPRPWAISSSAWTARPSTARRPAHRRGRTRARTASLAGARRWTPISRS